MYHLEFLEPVILKLMVNSLPLPPPPLMLQLNCKIEKWKDFPGAFSLSQR